MILRLVSILCCCFYLATIGSLYSGNWLCTAYSFLLAYLEPFYFWFHNGVSSVSLSFYYQTSMIPQFSLEEGHALTYIQILSFQVQVDTVISRCFDL